MKLRKITSPPEAPAPPGVTAEYDIAPQLVSTANGIKWLICGGLIFAIIIDMILLALYPDSTPNFVSELITLAATLFGLQFKESGAMVAHRFDGTPSTNAMNERNARIASNGEGQ